MSQAYFTLIQSNRINLWKLFQSFQKVKEAIVFLGTSHPKSSVSYMYEIDNTNVNEIQTNYATLIIIMLCSSYSYYFIDHQWPTFSLGLSINTSTKMIENWKKHLTMMIKKRRMRIQNVWRKWFWKCGHSQFESHLLHCCCQSDICTKLSTKTAVRCGLGNGSLKLVPKGGGDFVEKLRQCRGRDQNHWTL
jgi:hypothetical protein